MHMQTMLSRVRRCVEDYKMIEAGDKIAVGVSGGKDSLTALVTLHALSKFYPKPFSVCAISLAMSEDTSPLAPVAELCQRLEIPYHVIPTNIFHVVFNVRQEKNPCSLCANLRRGSLNNAAKSLGCNKVALGHHQDDAVETFLMSLFYEGRISCFTPVTYLDRVGITVLRPLLYCEESMVKSFAKRMELPIVHNPCPANGRTKRQETKDFIQALRKTQPDLRKKLFGAMQRLPLEGWGVNSI
jgi:tRNA 2-thiocytidine biosynthesis protein TtcA